MRQTAIKFKKCSLNLKLLACLDFQGTVKLICFPKNPHLNWIGSQFDAQNKCDHFAIAIYLSFMNHDAYASAPRRMFNLEARDLSQPIKVTGCVHSSRPFPPFNGTSTLLPGTPDPRGASKSRGTGVQARTSINNLDSQ